MASPRSHREGPLRIGVLGCGNVGSRFVELVDTGAEAIAQRTGIELEVSRIAVRSLDKDRGDAVGKRLTSDAVSVVTDSDVDLVVELIGGVDEARSLVLQALSSRKPVISANKTLLSTSAGELLAAADAAGVDLLYEASVAGAIPLVRLLNQSLAGERIERISGIVNGTTNYMLTRMSEEGLSYAQALAEAQALGFAEADPSADVEGHDAASKTAILAGIAFDADVTSEDVYREGITRIGPDDIAFAQRLGYEVKLLAVVERTSTSGLSVRVHPAMVPRTHPLASVRGPFNAVFLDGAAAGELMVYGRGAGGLPTASAVLGDVIEAAHHLREGTRARAVRRRAPSITPILELRTQYYLSIDVLDQPGVLAAVASVFGDHNVSIRSMEQVGLGGEARLVFITHTALEADMQATLRALSNLDVVDRVGCTLRVFGPEVEAPSGSVPVSSSGFGSQSGSGFGSGPGTGSGSGSAG